MPSSLAWRRSIISKIRAPISSAPPCRSSPPKCGARVSMDSLSEIERLGFRADDLPPDVQAEQREEFRLVADAIAQLPAKCREAFVLRKVQGLSQRETAQKLGLSESTVEKHVGRGSRHLIIICGRGGKSGQAAANDQIPDAERYDSQGKQCADRATGGHVGGPA